LGESDGETVGGDEVLGFFVVTSCFEEENGRALG
jgi:hypothetical protein